MDWAQAGLSFEGGVLALRAEHLAFAGFWGCWQRWQALSAATAVGEHLCVLCARRSMVKRRVYFTQSPF